MFSMRCTRSNYHLLKQFSTSAPSSSRVAVVLSGSGVYDGSEIHEASAILVHLSRHGADVGIYAPDKPQYHVINHCTGTPNESDTRNVLVESARIARGDISALSSLNPSQYDAIVFPGGFGAAKNLSSFAFDGEGLSVDDDVIKAINSFMESKKPLGFCCISPVIAAKVIPGVELTVGMDTEQDGKWPYAGTAAAIDKLGAKHINREHVTDIVVDDKLKVVSTPAFMCNAPLHLVYEGIGNMITAIMTLVTTPTGQDK